MAGTSAVVDGLYEARAHGRGPIPDAPDVTRDEALDLQLAVLDRFVAAGDALAGWKVSFTSGKSRDRMGPGYRPFGYIVRSRVFSSGATVTLAGEFGFALEPELCLVLGAKLRGPVDREAARAAVAGVAPAFEINQQRLAAAAPDALRLVDGTGNWGIVVGSPSSAARDGADLAAIDVRVFAGDQQVGSSPATPDMDDPFASLATLATLLDRHGRGLEPGDRVITGSFTRVAVAGPARFRATFDGVGEVVVDVAQ
ncbi:MAG TPA: fumarylacetoacetate hydrolase family protein [Cellulomonas sp.]